MFVLDEEETGFQLDQELKPQKKKAEIVSAFQFDTPEIESSGFVLDEEEPGLLSKAYQKTLKPVLDFFATNEIGSEKLIPIEGVEKPKPTDNTSIATLQLLSNTPDILREETLEAISKLNKEGKLFTEEAIERLPIDKEFSRKVLITGLGEEKQFRREISFSQAIKEGQQESAFGIITGRSIKDYETLLNRAESEIPFLKRQAKNLSKIIGDLPAFVTGGAIASLPAGGPETPLGAVLAVVGAFSTQALIESASNEALRLVHQNPELEGKTLQQLSALVSDPEALKNIGLSTIESGALGALIAVNPLFKALEKTSIIAKLLKKPVVRGAAKLGTEVTTLTTVPAILRGRIPTAEDFLDNTILLGGLKATGKAIEKVASYAKRNKIPAEDVVKKIGEHVTQKDLLDLEGARTIEEVDAIFKDIEERKIDAKEELAAEPKVVEPEKEVKETKPETKPDAAKQPQEIAREKLTDKQVVIDPANVKKFESLPKEVKEATIFRGEGGKPTFDTDVGSVLGKGKYFAFNESDAKEFGPNITTRKIEAKNPLVIRNDAEWRKWIKENTDNRFPNPTGLEKKDTKRNVTNISEAIKKSGHDAVIVHWVDSETADNKLLRDVFGVPQVFFPEKIAVVKPVIKAPEVSKPLKSKREGLEQPEQIQRPLEIGTEKDVPKKSEIINVFREAFKDTPIRIGKFAAGTSKTTSGFFRPRDNVIRLKESGMIETAAHEVGHKLHMALLGGEGDLKTQSANIRRILKPFMDELKPISRYEPHAFEGFAEFTRMYVTNPKAAKELAPRFYKFFEKELESKAPSVKEAMLQAREMYERFIKADAVARTYAHIQSSFDKNLWQKSGDFFNKNFNVDKLKTDWLDESFPVKRAMADTLGIKPVEVENINIPINPYIALRVLKGWVGKADVMLSHETFSFRTLEKNGISFEEVMQPIKTIGDRQNLSAFLVAKKSELLRKRNIKTGLDQKTAVETVKRLKEKYDPLSEELNDFQDRILQYYRDSGMISNESYNKMKAINKFYVPLFRFFEESEKEIGVRGKESGKLQAKNVIKRIFGSQREIIDPLESIVSNTFAMVQQAEKNAFGQKLSLLTELNPRGGKFMERVPPKTAKVFEISRLEIIDAMIKEAKKEPGKLEKLGGDEELMEAVIQMVPETIQKWGPTAWSPAENIVTVYRDGKPIYYETTKEIAELFKRGGSQLEASILQKIAIFPAKTLRAGAILNPKFMLKNAVRDLVGGIVYTKHNAVPIISDIYSPFAGLMHSIKKSDTYVAWLKAGGGMATMQSIDKSVATIKKGLGKNFNPIAQLRRVAEISEEMNRIAEFTKAIEATGTDRWQQEMAAFQSRDISIDFAKIGLRAKAINQAIPFWNATIQGGDKLIRTLASKDPEVIQNFLVRATAGIVMPTLMIEATNQGDPDIAEIDEATKDTNWVFKDTSGDIIQIPVPFETGVLFHGLSRRLFQYIVNKDPNAFDGFFGSIEQAATPGIIPAIALPFLEVWANRDFWRNRHIIHPSQVGLISEEQYGVFTSSTARLIGQAMSYMPGINAYESNLTSPAIIDHFIKTYGAGLGQLALRASDKALKTLGVEPAVAKPEERLLRQLGFDAFLREFPTARTKSVEKFYDTWNIWSKLERSIKSKIEKGDVLGAKRLQADLKKITPLDMKPMVKALQQNQALINNVFHNPKMSAKDKRMMIDRLYMQQIVMARGFVLNMSRK